MTYTKCIRPLIAATLLAIVALPAAAADRRVDRTGSRVGSDATGRMVIRFSEPNETRRVLALLEQGDTEAALRYAEDYLASLGSASAVNLGGAALPERYFALNALCAVLTRISRLDEAVARCTEAVDLVPSRWTALNNRGSARYLQGDYVGALEDYEAALRFARGKVRETVEHNIALTEAQIAERNADR